jgi:mRNA (guanine-N7-)-methyltransferase
MGGPVRHRKIHAQRDFVQNFYDRATTQNVKQTRKERSQGSGFTMKKFHNQVKRALLEDCSLHIHGEHPKKLLDLCCGRGGDIDKWSSAGFTQVVACDLSSESLVEAKRRWTEYQAKRYRGRNHGNKLSSVDFFHETELHTQLWRPPTSGDGRIPRTFDVVSCMFAMQYFCGTESDIRHLLSTASENLRPEGFFVGCVPDAQYITKLWNSQNQGHYQSGILSVRSENYTEVHSHPEMKFGHAYHISIGDTITSNSSREFLVWPELIAGISQEYGLEACMIEVLEEWRGDIFNAVMSYRARMIDPNALNSTIYHPHGFSQFKPPENLSEEWKVVSRLFSAFVFRKKNHAPSATTPPNSPHASTALTSQQSIAVYPDEIRRVLSSMHPFPVACTSCNARISQCWIRYQQGISRNECPYELLDSLGIHRGCCRGSFLTHVDLPYMH